MWTGNVPIFVPMYWPHGYYNLRYGVQLLPALALFAGWQIWQLFRREGGGWRGGWVAGALCALLLLGYLRMFRGRGPMVYAEAAYNSTGRLAQERQLAAALRRVRPDDKILMYIGTFPGALADDGIALKRVINESNYQLWDNALRRPQRYVEWIVLERHTWLARGLNRRALGRYFTPAGQLHVPGQHTITLYRRIRPD